MGRTDFNPEWYGAQAKVLTSNEDQMVVDYGCNGRGIVKSYKLFDGIQLCFLDFETDESMKAQKFNPDIIQVTHCQTDGTNVNLPIILWHIYRRAILALQQQRIYRLHFLFPWGSIMASVLS